MNEQSTSPLLIVHAQDEWGTMHIADQANERSLYFSDDAQQSAMWLDAPFDLTIEYTQLLMASLLFIRAPRSILLLGLGGGSLAKFLWKTFPKSQIHCVELRAQLITWAEKFFFLPKSPRLHIHEGDAREFIAQCSLPPFDLIVVDLFNEKGMSELMVQPEFFSRCKQLLHPKGVLGWNIWKSTPQLILQTCLQNLKQIFGKHILFLPSRSEENVTLLGLPKSIKEYKTSKLKAKAEKLSALTHLNFPFLMHSYHNFKKNTLLTSEQIYCKF